MVRRYHDYIEFSMCDVLFSELDDRPFDLSAGDEVAVHTTSETTHKGTVHSASNAHVILMVHDSQVVVPTATITGVTPELFS